jgi:hypothetical protein
MKVTLGRPLVLVVLGWQAHIDSYIAFILATFTKHHGLFHLGQYRSQFHPEKLRGEILWNAKIEILEWSDQSLGETI